MVRILSITLFLLFSIINSAAAQGISLGPPVNVVGPGEVVPEPIATPDTRPDCCVCYYDPAEPRFKVGCQSWLEEEPQRSQCGTKKIVALASAGVCPPQSCNENFPSEGCRSLRVMVKSHSVQQNCRPFVDAAVSLCLSVGAGCGNIQHSGCSTFTNYQEAIDYLTQLQGEHPELNLQITANQCPSFSSECDGGREVPGYGTPCLIVVEPSGVSCSLPVCEFGGDCRNFNRPSIGRCEGQSQCVEWKWENGEWRSVTRTRVCCPDQWKYAPSEECQECNGVCCLFSGDCRTRVSQRDCSAAGTAWMPGVVSCEPNVCPQDLGACCSPHFSCSDRSTKDNCEPFGTWFRGSRCNEINCQEDVPGSCCRRLSCTESVSPRACAGGQFRPGESCADCFPTQHQPPSNQPGGGWGVR